MTIAQDYRIEISRRLHSDYSNGKDYYRHHGERLLILPDSPIDRPSLEFLEWHNENVFLG